LVVSDAEAWGVGVVETSALVEVQSADSEVEAALLWRTVRIRAAASRPVTWADASAFDRVVVILPRGAIDPMS
jgi:hypothetical protein